jgi:hypothetical protein
LFLKKASDFRDDAKWTGGCLKIQKIAVEMFVYQQVADNFI